MATEQKKAEAPAEERALAVVDTSLKAYQEEFARLLGSSIDPEVFMSVAYEAFRTNPDLLEIALHSPDSLMKALHDAAALKLLPNGVLGSAYIVPRRNSKTGRREAYFQAGYRGLVELIMRSGHVSNVQSRVVYLNEPFRIVYGTQPRIEHEPLLDGAERGAVRGVYAVAKMRDGESVIDYMTVDQVNAIRKRSPSNTGPWSTDYEEMARKTVIRRLAKALPMSVEVQQAIGLDDDAERSEAVVATVTEPTAEAASLAGRIRQNIAAAEPPEQIEQVKEEPKNVTPDDFPSRNLEEAMQTAPQADEPPAAAAPKARTRKAAPKADEPQEAAPVASDDPIETTDDVPDEEPASRKFGKLAGGQSWQGLIYARDNSETSPMLFRNDAAEASWTGRLVPGDDDVKAFFDSIVDQAYNATIAGELELVPWDRDGKAMPPFRQITVGGIEVGLATYRPA